MNTHMENQKNTADTAEAATTVSALKRAEKAVNATRPGDNLLRFEVSTPEAVAKALAVTDLTADDAPVHAINLVYKKIKAALSTAGWGEIRVIRGDPIVPVLENFDKLLFPADNAGRASTYTRYTDENHILRTHTSAHIPATLKAFYEEFDGDIPDTIFMLPGLVYRRDVIDPKHLDVFHQLDIWTMRKNNGRPPLGREELLRLIGMLFEAVVPDKKPIVYEAVHPYTVKGIEVYAKFGESELEILEAGLSHPDVLRAAGFDPEIYSSLASGLGIDRLVMSLKEMGDVRFLRSVEPRISAQMVNTEKFKEVSSMPPISRDMSYCVPENDTEEDINEEIKNAFGEKAFLVENVSILSRTKFADLPPIAQEKLGTSAGQDNVLVKITLRHPDATLTKKEANELYDAVYPKLHKGTKGYL